MDDPAESTLLKQGRQAASRRDWQPAFELLTDADARTPLGGSDLPLLADVAYAAGHLDVTVDVWERVHASCLRAGDEMSAAGAAVRVAMHLLFDAALMAPVRGWVKRAERLLDPSDETPVHAWLAVVKSYERLLAGDFEQACHLARRAIDIGSNHEPAAAAIGRVAEARSLILEGQVPVGLGLLDEAAVAAVSGELDALSTGIVYCELVCGLQALAQYDRAQEWTEAMERWRHGGGVGSIHGRCRVHRAEILRLRGDCEEAQDEILRACEELRPYLRREFGWPLTELGRIRLRLGNLRGAEDAFVAAHEAGWDPQPGLALVRLEQGDVASAAALIRDALEHPLNVPSKELPPNTGLRRAPLLEAQVEIAVAAGDIDRARSAADELGQVATRFGSKALAASAALATGRIALAEGNSARARIDLERAKDLWNEVGAPYEAALACMGLGDAHRIDANDERALLEFRAARAAFERIGATGQADRAARAARGVGGDFGSRAVVRNTEPGVFRLEGDYWLVVFEEHSVRVRDLKGLRYLARLLASPGREFHVLDLVVLERGVVPEHRRVDSALTFSGSADSGEVLDAQAKEAYRRRLAEIEEDIEEARTSGDHEREAQADAERDFLVRELSRAVGLGGRNRRAGSASERARVSVTRALRHAMARVAAYHPAFGAHLDHSVRTGTYCTYAPDPRAAVIWHT